jgi:hypothetical protein
MQDSELSKQKKPYAEISLDGGEIYTGVLEAPIADDWSPILKSFGLDPDVFMVVDDKVKMSKWQQSKRTESGDRDIVWLYAYKAQFTRRTTPKITENEIENIRNRRQRRNDGEAGFDNWKWNHRPFIRISCFAARYGCNDT